MLNLQRSIGALCRWPWDQTWKQNGGPILKNHLLVFARVASVITIYLELYDVICLMGFFYCLVEVSRSKFRTDSDFRKESKVMMNSKSPKACPSRFLHEGFCQHSSLQSIGVRNRDTWHCLIDTKINWKCIIPLYVHTYSAHACVLNM